MELFNTIIDQNKNLLPYDGEVYYYGLIYTHEEAALLFNLLLEEIEWKNDESMMYGKLIVTKRKVAWYGDKPFEYTYSNRIKIALPWTSVLLDIKNKVEQISGKTFNSCLLNLYHDGSEGMAWHSDGEKDLKKHGSIASLSFGVARKFMFKHKNSGTKISILLEPGSLLIMQGITQEFWLHRLPPTALVKNIRINLTFRTIEK